VQIFIMRRLLLAILLASLLLPGQALGASQISPRDNLWISLPPDSTKCIVIRLPHDAGLTQDGNYIFTVSCTPGPLETWSDLSNQIFREIHENNTAEIPICFDTSGNKPVGNCSVPYTISVVEEFTGTMKEWHGGFCVSSLPDVDIVSPGETPTSGEDVEDILNDNTDIFAAWFDREEQYVKPGQEAVFNLSLQSHASLNINVLTQSTMEVSPGQATIRTSSEKPYHYQAFKVTTPSEEGTYKLEVRISPDTCLGESYCTKFLEGTLIVSEDDPPEKTGFEVVLRPENLDIKEPEEVIMTLSIINNEDEPRTFTSTVVTYPDDASSGFKGETVEIGSHDSHSRVFVVIPGNSSKLYEVTARADFQGITSSATSFITIDEMVTDALRMASGLGPDADSQVNSWINSHANSDYGSDLDDYGSLRDTLASAREDGQDNQTVDGLDGQDGVDDGVETPDITGILIPIIVLALIVIAILFFIKKSSGKKESEDVEYY
jgi:hypothetical protein